MGFGSIQYTESYRLEDKNCLSGKGFLLVTFVSNTNNSVSGFDEANIVMRLAVVSDLHFNQGKEKFDECLKQLYANAGEERLDALLVAGDLTDNGICLQVRELKKVLDKHELAKKGTKFFFALGNHDLAFDEKPYNGEMFKKYLGDYAFEGASKEEIKNGNHHQVIKGYHFIASNCKIYNGGCHHLQEDLDWLKTALDEAQKDDPQRPIFLLTHPVIYDTVYGSKESTYWYSNNIDELLKNYPQVITFGGHLHFPLHDERNIHQRYYTAIQTGCTLYCSLESEIDGIKPIDTKGGMEPSDCHDFSQGLYLEVDGHHNVRVTRMDFYNKAQIKHPWVIPAPKEDGSHLNRYTSEAILVNNKAPSFQKGSSVNVSRKGTKQIEISFDAACDDDYVYYYEIHLLDKDTLCKVGKSHVITYSDFYRFANPKDMKKRLKKVVDVELFQLPTGFLEREKKYVVKIIAVDTSGLKSEPLYSEHAF